MNDVAKLPGTTETQTSARFKLLASGTVATLIVALVVSIVPAASADSTITLSGRLRDFQHAPSPNANPDFEAAIGDDRGIVLDTLGLDGSPVYDTVNHPGGTSTTHGPGPFDQWYHDTPGFNIAVPYDITLTQIPGSSPATYQYSNNDFFPLDGQGWNADPSTAQVDFGHNFSFTYQVHNTFTYQGGETFFFSGDDDVFVFVNHHLIVDLGGVHGTESATVNLDSVAAAAGMAIGGTYDFDFFFAERHTTGSNFTMTTTIALQPPAPTLHPTSTVVDCSPNPVLGGQTTTCTATVTDTASSGQTTPTGTVSFATDGSGSFTGTPCTLAAVSTGVARCSVSYTPASTPSNPDRTEKITASYGGDSTHATSQGTTDLRILSVGAVAGGSFVIGNQKATAGSRVTYWSSQWPKLNPMSGGPAPAAFKGFAATGASTLPTCEQRWTTQPGNSSNPPASVPSLMAVIASSSIVKSGSAISGDTTRVVVVRTDAGYGPAPGHEGTGTVVAVIC